MRLQQKCVVTVEWFCNNTRKEGRVGVRKENREGGKERERGGGEGEKGGGGRQTAESR